MAKGPAIEIEGLKETIRGLNQIEDAVADMKLVHQRIGAKVLASAQGRMNRVSGDLIGSYKYGKIKSGAKIYSKLVYAGVSEFGGTIPRYHSDKRTKHKPKAPDRSYYVYPAVDENEEWIESTYHAEIQRLRRTYLPDSTS